MADVAFNEVDKVYDNGVQAVFALTLDIHDGEFLVLVGPSGCGKTTALRMVAGLETISGGELSIGGRVVNDVTPKERDIAMVFQNYALYPHMNVRENLGFGLSVRHTPKSEIRQRVQECSTALHGTPARKVRIVVTVWFPSRRGRPAGMPQKLVCSSTGRSGPRSHVHTGRMKPA